MAKCRLYLQWPDFLQFGGEFKSREQAENYFNYIKDSTTRPNGQQAVPIYVEQGKGRGK